MYRFCSSINNVKFAVRNQTRPFTLNQFLLYFTSVVIPDFKILQTPEGARRRIREFGATHEQQKVRKRQSIFNGDWDKVKVLDP